MATDSVLKFFFELGQLSRVRHEGFGLALVDPAPSVSGHNLRVAQIAYVLARLERYSNPFEVCTLAVFHEIG